MSGVMYQSVRFMLDSRKKAYPKQTRALHSAASQSSSGQELRRSHCRKVIKSTLKQPVANRNISQLRTYTARNSVASPGRTTAIINARVAGYAGLQYAFCRRTSGDL